MLNPSNTSRIPVLLIRNHAADLVVITVEPEDITLENIVLVG
jgi:hypothetical protein